MVTPTPLLTTRVEDQMPTGAVTLLARSLGDGWSRPVAWIRAAHMAWMLAAVHPGRARIVVAREGERLVGLAVTVRYDARPRVVHVAAIGLLFTLLGSVLGALASALPIALVAATGALAGAALVLDGRRGLAGMQVARQHARRVGADRSWGRGLVAVTATDHGRGIGTQLTRRLIESLPEGDRWLPVAKTRRAGALYQRLGARPLAGAASELVVPATAV